MHNRVGMEGDQERIVRERVGCGWGMVDLFVGGGEEGNGKHCVRERQDAEKRRNV